MHSVWDFMGEVIGKRHLDRSKQKRVSYNITYFLYLFDSRRQDLSGYSSRATTYTIATCKLQPTELLWSQNFKSLPQTKLSLFSGNLYSMWLPARTFTRTNFPK